MHYTIASLEEVHGNLTLNLDSSGNKYVVGLYNKDTKEYTHTEFETIGNAYAVFETLARCICMSLYSYEEKKEMLIAQKLF
jgi:hypothetical protein